MSAPDLGSASFQSGLAVRVDETMSRRVVTCTPDTPVSAVARRMAQEQVHCLIVRGIDRSHGGRQLGRGVVTDTDLLRLATAGDEELTAADVASPEVAAIEPAATVGEAAEAMRGRGIAHLVVVEPATGRAVGVISTLDLAAVLGRTHS